MNYYHASMLKFVLIKFKKDNSHPKMVNPVHPR